MISPIFIELFIRYFNLRNLQDIARDVSRGLSGPW